MFAQRYVNNFKSFAILVFYISLIEVITPHKRVARSGTLVERKAPKKGVRHIFWEENEPELARV